MDMTFRCGTFNLTFQRPLVMGIVNVTPDSFSDGGQFRQTEQAVAQALKLVEEGADILDIGGESTRPHATPVPLEEELSRVIPVIQALSPLVNVPISIDTYKPEVMRQAIRAGASMVNDVQALQAPGALEIVANSQVGVCLMHMQGTPQTMQINPVYVDVVHEVKEFLLARIRACEAVGIAKERIVVDPGFGFGKKLAHNLALIQQLEHLVALGFPVLVGLSRKSILGQIVGQDVETRVFASVAAAVISAVKGAKILRVHDVKATVEALRVVNAIY